MKAEQWYIYQAPVLVHAAANTQQVSLNFDSDADFICTQITGTVLQANLVVGTWGGTIQMVDSASGTNLFSDFIPFESLRGNGQMPYVLNPYRKFASNSIVTITTVNPVVTATQVYVTLHGYKIYKA